MGLFSKKDSTKKVDDIKDVKEAPVKEVSKKSVKKTDKESDFAAGEVLKNPRITEKAAYASDNNVYTFDVSPRASKIEVEKAVKDIYKVTPIKVNILAIPTKKVFRRNSVGVKGGGKKAYVFLKKGDKIEFV